MQSLLPLPSLLVVVASEHSLPLLLPFSLVQGKSTSGSRPTAHHLFTQPSDAVLLCGLAGAQAHKEGVADGCGN